MPRTIEHIVECHKAAVARRAAGKPIWDKKIDIKAILLEDLHNDSNEHLANISVRIAARLRAKVPAGVFDFCDADYDSDLTETLEAMEDCSVAALTQDEKNGCRPVDIIDGWLETIYDWADANRVWLGD